MISDELHVLRNMFDCISLWAKVIARSQLANNKDPKVIREICYILQEIQILEFDYIKALDSCEANQRIFNVPN